jgi:hypothetical protein
VRKIAFDLGPYKPHHTEPAERRGQRVAENYHQIVDALTTDGQRRDGANDFTCPTHEDNKPSLSVTLESDRILVYCHRGCRTEDVLDALGMRMSDLFGGPHEIEDVYRYTDKRGKVLFEVVRWLPKSFSQRRPNGSGGYINSVKGVQRVLYHLPKVLDAIAREEPIYVVEGEKDVHAIEAAGAVATTNPMGAGKWHDDHAQALRGATDVRVVADKDAPGAKHALEVAASLERLSVPVRVLSPKEGRDAADHLAAGHALEDFVPFVGAELMPVAPDDPAVAERVRRLDIDEMARTVRAERDAPPVQVEGWPQMLARPTGRELVSDTGIIEGGVILVYGGEGSYKSATLQTMAWALGSGNDWQYRERLGSPLSTFYIALEGGPGLKSRAKAWESANPDRPEPRWHVQYSWGDLANPTYLAGLVDRIAAAGANVAVLDTYGLAITYFKAGMGNENTDANAFVGRLRDVAAQVTERTGQPLTWLLIHHEGWEAGRPRGARALIQACDLALRMEKDPRLDNVAYVRRSKGSRDLDHLFRSWAVRAAPQRWGDAPEEASFLIYIDDDVPEERRREATGDRKTNAENHEDVFNAVGAKFERTADIEARLTYAHTTVHRHLVKLAEEKRVVRQSMKDKETRRQVDVWKRAKP